MEAFWIVPVWICLGAVAALLVAEGRGSAALAWLAKPLAALAFIAAALTWGALDSGYGRWILLGLALSAVGDVLLIPTERERWFLAGIGAFLLGHVAYVFAFATLPLHVAALAAAALGMALFAAVVLIWLLPYAGADFRRPVAAYVAVISAMVAMAASAMVAGAHFSVLIGAVAFAVSDLSVARDRFVAPGFVNRLWGLPLYFAAQLVLAYTVTLI